jgi:hypothetical protein
MAPGEQSTSGAAFKPFLVRREYTSTTWSDAFEAIRETTTNHGAPLIGQDPKAGFVAMAGVSGPSDLANPLMSLPLKSATKCEKRPHGRFSMGCCGSILLLYGLCVCVNTALRRFFTTSPALHSHQRQAQIP